MVNKFQNNTVRSQNELWNLIWILLDFQTADNLKIFQLVRQFKKRDIMNTCNQNSIPIAVIEPTVLYKDLLTLQKQLNARGQDLAIPVKDVSRLYQIPICDCTLSHNNIIIHVKIPIIQQTKQWTLFELKTTPFKWDQETCVIEHGILYLAVSPDLSMEDNIRQIAGMGLHNCKPYHDKLCYIPSFAADSLYGPACARKLFIGDSVQVIAKFCNMRCYRSSATVISELDDSTFLITHVKPNTAVWCASKVTNVSQHLIGAPGAVKIKLSCDCELRVGNTQLIPKRFPCPEESAERPEFVHVLPAVWSKLQSFILNPLSRNNPSRFKNVTEALNTNWTLETPYINITTSQNDVQKVY